MTVAELRRELARALDELDAECARLDALPRSKYRTSTLAWHLIGRTHMLGRELEALDPAAPEVRRWNRGLARALVTSEAGYQACVGAPAKTPAEWARLARTRVTEQRRQKVVARLAGKLLSQGVDGELVVELMRAQDLHRCDPPLGPVEVERIVGWAASREVERLEGAA